MCAAAWRRPPLLPPPLPGLVWPLTHQQQPRAQWVRGRWCWLYCASGCGWDGSAGCRPLRSPTSGPQRSPQGCSLACLYICVKATPQGASLGQRQGYESLQAGWRQHPLPQLAVVLAAACLFTWYPRAKKRERPGRVQGGSASIFPPPVAVHALAAVSSSWYTTHSLPRAHARTNVRTYTAQSSALGFVVVGPPTCVARH